MGIFCIFGNVNKFDDSAENFGRPLCDTAAFLV